VDKYLDTVNNNADRWVRKQSVDMDDIKDAFIEQEVCTVVKLP